MLLKKLDQIAVFDIWQPRWHDKIVLLSVHKVDKAKTDHIKVVFSKAPSMDGDWYASRKAIMRCPKETNGTIQCYAVPLDKLEPLQINHKDWRELV